ncbi:MAG: type II secretion system protein GspG [Phycisphaerales bacterium]|nr:type II secretion system protein GspG [Phycisphaerales bacterium]
MKQKDPHWHRSGSRYGMTFVELLAVLVILGLVAGVFSVSIAGRFSQSKRELAKSQLGLIDGQVQAYYTLKSTWPPVDRGLAVLTSPDASPSDAYFLSADQLLDPWGNHFYIIVPGPEGHPYELVSYGADGQPGGMGADADLSSLRMRD